PYSHPVSNLSMFHRYKPFYLCFYGHGNSHDLHSCPTRRSSDLPAGPASHKPRAAPATATHPGAARARLSTEPGSARAWLPRGDCPLPWPIGATRVHLAEYVGARRKTFPARSLTATPKSS